MDPHPHKGKQCFCNRRQKMKIFLPGARDSTTQHMQLSADVCLDTENTSVIYAPLSWDISCASLPLPPPTPPPLLTQLWRAAQWCVSKWNLVNSNEHSLCVYLRESKRKTGSGGKGLWERGRRERRRRTGGAEWGVDCERKQGFSCGTDAARVAVGSTAVADKRCF